MELLPLFAADGDDKLQAVNWLAVQHGLLMSALFTFVGVLFAIVGFKLFDWLTPGDMQKEVFEKNNIAAAILGGAMILGICQIIASSFH